MEWRSMTIDNKNIWKEFLCKMPSLFFGFLLFAVAILLALYSDLGMSPWDVFHMGVVNHSILSLGQVSQIVGLCLIMVSVFLGVIPGVGSLCNMIFIGLFVDLINNAGIIKTPESITLKLLMLISAIFIMGIATYFYLRVELGAGPRDGLMEGLVRKLKLPVWVIRGSIELTVLTIGFFLGGPVGIGTLLLAATIGLSVQFAFKLGKYDSKKARHRNLLDLSKTVRGINNFKSACCFTLFLAVSMGLPFFSFEGYSILSNTTSHLAAQGSPFAWVMDIVFVCLGFMAMVITYGTRARYHQVIGGMFGLSLIMTAFFPHAPLVEGVPVNLLQDQVHSIFASLTGFGFTLLTIGHSVMSRGKQRALGVVMTFVAIIISIGMMAFPTFMGLLQRIMFISAFGWLFFYMKPPQQNEITEEGTTRMSILNLKQVGRKS